MGKTIIAILFLCMSIPMTIINFIKFIKQPKKNVDNLEFVLYGGISSVILIIYLIKGII